MFSLKKQLTVNDRLSTARLFHFPVIGAALIRERHFFSNTSKTQSEIYRELSETRTSYAQFNIKYVHHEHPLSRVSNCRTHEFVEVLFLKRDGFDISLYKAP